jgi:hypothetical protein
MFKKLLLLLLVLIAAYTIFLPELIQKKQDEFQAAGVGDTSVLNLLDPNENQNR